MAVPLSEFDESARVFDWSRRKNAVTQIQDVPDRSGLFENLFRFRLDAVSPAQEDAWIEIALQRHPITDAAARFGHRNPPIDADHIRAGACHGFENCGTAVQVKDAGHAISDS